MPRGNRTEKRGHRPRREGKNFNIKLTPKGQAIAEAIAPNRTAGIEASLEVLEIVVDSAARGDKKAIAFLKKIGVEVQFEELEPITVKRSDGTIAAWII